MFQQEDNSTSYEENKINIIYDNQSFEDINFRSAILHADYIGWKYNIIPKTLNERVVVLNNYFTETESHEWYGNVVFKIRTWDDFDMERFPTGYYMQILIFSSETTNEEIIKCVTGFIKQIMEKQKCSLVEEYDKFMEKLKLSKSIDGIDWSLIIMIEKDRLVNKRHIRIGTGFEDL